MTNIRCCLKNLLSCAFNSFRRAAIHAEAPEFVEMSTEQEILVTGIKVVDLLAPYAKGGKIGMFHWLLRSQLCVFICDRS